jgi:hypothetical protein
MKGCGISLFASLFLSLSLPVPVGTKVERDLLPIDGGIHSLSESAFYVYATILPAVLLRTKRDSTLLRAVDGNTLN